MSRIKNLSEKQSGLFIVNESKADKAAARLEDIWDAIPSDKSKAKAYLDKHKKEVLALINSFEPDEYRAGNAEWRDAENWGY